jgi:cohesin loading factor subunit SCC2
MQSSISEDVFMLMLGLYELAPTPTFGDTAMRSLGFIFRAYPSFTQRPRMATVIQRTLSKGSVPERELVLKIILELLATEQKRAAPEVMKRKPGTTIAVKAAPSPQKKVDMSELVGNTETFADSGVSAALIQSYLDLILRASREIEHAFLQRAAMEILKFTVQQGLSHPLQCVPTLIALETVADETIASKALYLHDYLASKHASILAARYLDFTRASFDFQRVVCTGPVRGEHREVETCEAHADSLSGYRTAATSGAPTALLRHWYTLVRDKRNTRLDFLKAITRGLDVNTASGKCTELHVTFARYIADNLAVLEYKTLEEVFVVLAQLRTMLGVTGMMVLQYVEDELAADAGDSDDEGEQSDEEAAAPEQDSMLDKMVSQQQVARPDFADTSPQDESNDASQAGPAPATRAPKWPMFSTARAALVMGTCIVLRNHLKAVYGISEA